MGVDLLSHVSTFFIFLETYMSYTAKVTSPCSGDQTLSQINADLYQGTVGDFDLGVLASHTSQGWLLTIYDYSNPGSSCYPFITYGQVTPNASDPTGPYGKMVGGSPDTSVGSASIV